jgi:tRNA(Ile)-lysidine synthase
MVPAATLVARFAADLDRLIDSEARLGVAVSGGPDSLALLLLAAAARPGKVEAASVDHALRPESRAEAEMVAELCERLAVPHAILTVEWRETPRSGLQERARRARYEVLGEWLHGRGIGAIATGHHLDDQAETLVMRLKRGAGVRGLSGMRASAPLTGDPQLRLLRPLLGWTRGELEEVCAGAGIEPVRDPSNEDERHERVRIRRALAGADWLEPDALARSAAHLSQADEALEWAAGEEWRRIQTSNGEIRYSASNAPAEIRRRIVERAITQLASEGSEEPLRGREIDQLLEALEAGRAATLRGVKCVGGAEWRFSAAAPRRPTRRSR